MIHPTKTLKDVMPIEFMGCEYTDIQAVKFADVTVVKECDATEFNQRWPGKHKNVFCWVILSNGKAVGFNESPSRGWSFPIINYKG